MSHVKKHRFGHGVVVSKVCYGILEGVFSHLPCYCNELSFSQQCVGSGVASLSAAHVHKT